MRYLLILFLPLFMACTYPQILPVEGARSTTTMPSTPNDAANVTAGVPEKAPGCAVGGMGVHTPADVRCYLKQFDARSVRMINEDIAVLIFPDDSGADWIGGASIYHIPTVSTITLDRNGYVDPQWTSINSRTAWDALFNVLFDEELMEELRQAVADEWQMPDPEEVTLKLGTAYQDGHDIIFLWSLVGLDASDASFYCAEQQWRIGTTYLDVIVDCAEYQPPTERVGQMEYRLEGNEQTVHLVISGLQSNEIVVVVNP